MSLDADRHEELNTLKAERAALRECLMFFASVIKSGEPWTETCEKYFRACIDGPVKPS